MGNVLKAIDPEHEAWIKRQHVFFVATAPMARDGHINCSPKGSDTLRIIDPHTIAYQDLTGSGAETIAHLRENGRIVIMFCAFDGSPLILRLYGQGEVILPENPAYPELLKKFSHHAGTRAIIKVNVTRIAESCGMAVPLLSYTNDRKDLDEWAEAQGAEKLTYYRKRKNKKSVDDLPALDGVL